MAVLAILCRSSRVRYATPLVLSNLRGDLANKRVVALAGMGLHCDVTSYEAIIGTQLSR